MSEIWKDILGFEGLYKISNFGRVKSLSRKVILDEINFYTTKDRILKSSPSDNGYLKVTLSKNKVKSDGYIHRLVATHFIDNIENKECVNHIDGIKSNNTHTNLEWCSYKENTNHAVKLGIMNTPSGERQGFHKLTYESVSEIRKIKNKYSNKELGQMFGVHERTIYDVVKNITWRHNDH